VPLRELSDILWRERRLLELLQFKLEEERLLADAGRVRWLHRASREVALVRGELRRADLARAMAAESAASELGLGTNPTLRELAQASPEPWSGILDRHRRALLLAAGEVNELAAAGDGALGEHAES
jgi:hypothetical protein